jgi:hypothetical protein
VEPLEHLDDVLTEGVELVQLDNVPVCQTADRGAALQLPRGAGHCGGYARTGIDCLAVGRPNRPDAHIWYRPRYIKAAATIRLMAEESEREPVSEPDSVTPRSHPRSSLRGAAALPVVALVVAATALGLTGWMWFHPRSSNSPEAKTDPEAGKFVGDAVRTLPPGLAPEAYTDTQRTDAKTKICTAYHTVVEGVRRNNNLAPQVEKTPIGILAIAANGRVSLSDGGQYLLARLDPATPPDLADATRALANLFMDIGAAATAGVEESDPVQAPRLEQAQQLSTNINELCK